MVNKQKNTFITRLLSLFVVVLLLSAAVILRDGRIFGHDFGSNDAPSLTVGVANDTLSVEPDGSITVNSAVLAKDVQGFGGAVPLRIHISKEGMVTAIEALPNAETPSFFERAKTLFAQWQGKSVDEALNEEVDAVTGATFSSKAIIENVRRALTYAHKYATTNTTTTDARGDDSQTSGWTLAGIAALIVALLGAIVPLFVKNRRWHYVQLVLNVVVLGLWTGTFVSYTLLMRVFAGGISWQAIGTLAAPLVLMAVALLYPLAGRNGHYCAHICPFGSAQELASKLTKRTMRISPRTNTLLSTLRNVLWGVLMGLMLTGTWTAWIDYELFTAFLYTSVSVWVIVVAVVFLVLSVWIPRPYCRFVCPTGCLLRN